MLAPIEEGHCYIANGNEYVLRGNTLYRVDGEFEQGFAYAIDRACSAIHQMKPTELDAIVKRADAARTVRMLKHTKES